MQRQGFAPFFRGEGVAGKPRANKMQLYERGPTGWLELFMFMLEGVRGGGRKIEGNYKMKHTDVTYLTEWDVKQRRGWRKRWQKGIFFCK